MLFLKIEMRTRILFILILLSSFQLIAQDDHTGWDTLKLGTADKCTYMKAEERAMILEINMMRSEPQKYAKYLEPYLEKAKEDLKKQGKGTKHYSISTSYETINGKEKVKTDTIWHDRYQEEVNAVQSLIDELNSMSSLSILKPDKGIYEAAKKHGLDNSKHNWTLSHRGSDKSWPWDRIRKFSPKMAEGNENIASKGPVATPRDIVIQLLIDSGIPGYGHRKNLINPNWTHIACYYGGYEQGMHRWIQNFGKIKD